MKAEESNNQKYIAKITSKKEYKSSLVGVGSSFIAKPSKN